MGSAYRKLGLPREDELSGHGVSWCATCDGFFFRDQDIAVVGGGDTAMEEATFLTRFAKSVTVVHRRDALRASRIMADRAEANPKIRWAWNSEVVDIHGDSTVTGVRLRDTVTGDERDLAVGGLFIAIGHEPRSELVTGQVDLDDEGYILADGRAPAPTSTACSPPATSSTTPTGRRSPPPAPAARRRSTPSATWPRSPTPPGDRRRADDAGRQRRARESPARRQALTPTRHPTHTIRRYSMGSNTKTVTDASFASDVLQPTGPVLVDFWAEWCGPCRLVAPVLEEIAGEHADKLTIVKLNIDENPETARNYQVMSIPTMAGLPGRRGGQDDRRRQPEGRASSASSATTSADAQPQHRTAGRRTTPRRPALACRPRCGTCQPRGVRQWARGHGATEHDERTSTSRGPFAASTALDRRGPSRMQPLRRGDRRQRRRRGAPACCASLGLLDNTDPDASADVFDEATELAVRHFQQRRGISVDGAVGAETYAALTGAHWRLGDRVLAHNAGQPASGDDVAALQTAARARLRRRPGRRHLRLAHRRRRCAPSSATTAWSPTAICGPATLRALRQLGRRVVGGRPQLLREMVAVADAGPNLLGKRIVIDPGHGGADPGVDARGHRRGRARLGPGHPARGPADRARRADWLTRGRTTAPRDERAGGARQRGRRRPGALAARRRVRLAATPTAWPRTTSAPASPARRSASGSPTWSSASWSPAPGCSTAASTPRPGRCCG